MQEDRSAFTPDEREREKESQLASRLDRPRRGDALAALTVAAVLHLLALAPGALAGRAEGAPPSPSGPRRILRTSLPPPPERPAAEPRSAEPAPRIASSIPIPDADPVLPPFPAIEIGGAPPEAEILPAEPEPFVPPPKRRGSGEETQPALIRESRVEPTYPEIARRGAYEATVVLRAQVLASGRVGEVTALRCSHPNLGFEASAIRAIRQWRYEPARRDGRPVEAYAYVHVHFRIP
jgi:protein TonB